MTGLGGSEGLFRVNSGILFCKIPVFPASYIDSGRRIGRINRHRLAS
jgi:hypothetical protein